MARRLILPFVLAAAAGSGCTSDSMRWFVYVIAPWSQTKTQDAEFADLVGQKVAIAIFTNENVAYEYPYARLTVSNQVAAELEKRVKKIKVVEPVTVLRYQQENLNWDSMPRTELAKAFEADYLLFISLVEYTAREPNSTDLCRGRIVADASIYQASLPEDRSQVWNAAGISIVHPKDAPVGRLSREARNLLNETETKFVDALVKKFYKHKVGIEQ